MKFPNLKRSNTYIIKAKEGKIVVARVTVVNSGSSTFVASFCREKKELFIIDFGLSIYYNDKDYKNDKIIGSVKYCSLDVHNKKGIYYKDDLESVLYTFLNCYGIDLPWNNLIIKLDKSKLDERNILIDKIKLEKEKICDVLLLQPNILYESIIFIKYCRNLKSKELPNYNYLKGLFTNALILF